MTHGERLYLAACYVLLALLMVLHVVAVVLVGFGGAAVVGWMVGQMLGAAGAPISLIVIAGFAAGLACVPWIFAVYDGFDAFVGWVIDHLP